MNPFSCPIDITSVSIAKQEIAMHVLSEIASIDLQSNGDEWFHLLH